MMSERLPWLLTAFAIVATAALISLVAFGPPDVVMVGLARVTGMTRLLPLAATPVIRVQASRWAQDIDVLPAKARAPLPDDSAVGRLKALRLRSPLLIETATLVIPAGNKGLRIAAPSLTLRDVTIVTNGAPLEIETETLDVTNSAIRAFAAGAAEAGARAGGEVRFVVHGTMRGVLTVDLSGQPGAPGVSGTAGAPGAPGSRGEAARSGNTECKAAAGRGGDGQTGGAGRPGGDGAGGGHGGTLDLTARDALGLTTQVQFSAPGGEGGAGGPGGPGGKGGAGGAGGDPAGVCFGNGAPGKEGSPGPAGPAGRPGRPGDEGTLHVHELGT